MFGKSIGLIGAGKMGTALLKGILKAGLAKPKNVYICDIDKERCAGAGKELGVRVAKDNTEVVQNTSLIILAIKPTDMVAVLKQISDNVLPDKHLVVSIAAGVTTSTLEAGLKAGTRVIRVMPNVACMVGEAASCYVPGKNATDEDLKITGEILGSAGRAFLLDEKYLDAVTGLSGSGPAYAAMIIEALADGGVKMGLPRETAEQLAAQTLLGTSKMLLDGGYNTVQIKEIVTSPGGTTIEGLSALEKGGLRASLISAVEAATLKSRSLGQKSAKK
ncbi:MAG: pyrroline-5-carboxylate reductase [Candidatus Brocadiales bacterium]|nr:pyrroline-5-carboxylate reductase [Candidatus Bathyanammoxibius sp.]